MQTKIFSCVELAQKIQELVRVHADAFSAKYKRRPCLAVVLVGSDPASQIYVQKKGQACTNTGLEHKDFFLEPSVGFQSLIELIFRLNADPDIDGILVQSPLPKGWDEANIQSMVLPQKDVDGFHPQNAGLLFLQGKYAIENGLVPCTPAGVIEVLRDQKIPIAGRNAVVVGRSNIVGKPMAAMLLANDATVTICHSRTSDLKQICAQADILVSAMGKPRMIKRAFIKPGATVIDVGICRIQENGKSRIVGDADQEDLIGRAGFLTPVPGGIGPMTIALLMRNTVRAAWKLREDRSPL